MLQATITSFMQFPCEISYHSTPEYIKPMIEPYNSDDLKGVEVMDISFLKKLANKSSEVTSDKVVRALVFSLSLLLIQLLCYLFILRVCSTTFSY